MGIESASVERVEACARGKGGGVEFVHEINGVVEKLGLISVDGDGLSDVEMS